MTLYLNYAQAQTLMRGPDLFVVRTLAAIHRVMLEQANTSIRPQYTFDMCFFYNSAIKSVARHFGYVLNNPLLPCEKVMGINYPNLVDDKWQNDCFVQSGIATIFLNVVKSESSPGSLPFDVEFACAVASRAFDASTLKSIYESIGKDPYVPNDDCDTWLRGFST